MKHAIAIITALLVASQSALYAADAPQTVGNGAASTTQPGLPDMGQTIHYTQTFGEDADFAGSGPAYLDNGDGTVTDKVTGLMWQKTDGGDMTWERAKEYARVLKLGGHEDWRLPNSMELFAIVDHGKHGPAMNTEFFTRTAARYWWTDVMLAPSP